MPFGFPTTPGRSDSSSGVMEAADHAQLVERHWRPCFALGYRLTRDGKRALDETRNFYLQRESAARAARAGRKSSNA